MIVKRYEGFIDRIYTQTEKVQQQNPKRMSIIDSLKLEKNVVDFMKIQVYFQYFPF